MAALAVTLGAGAGQALAADPPAPAASAAEVPFWAVGMPKGNPLAPVAGAIYRVGYTGK